MALRFQNASRYGLTSFLVFLVIVTSFAAVFPSAFASPDTIIAVNPEVNVANVGETFTITVTIANVPDTITDVSGYQVKIGIDKNVLEVVPGSIIEGTFLSAWANIWETSTYFTFEIDDPNYVYVADVIMGSYPGAFGYDGELFRVTFRVIGPGVSSLNLYDSIIMSCDGATPPVPHYPPEFVEQDGTFHTPQPVASFFFTPKSYGRPIVGENVTFDASASYDPDGGAIVNYVWNFDDGTLGSGMIVKHIYQQASSPTESYNVTLTVTDDEGMNTTTWKKGITDRLDVKRHDISITKITAPDEIFLHGTASLNVTVKNNGSHPDTFNTTAYYNSKPIGTVKLEGLPAGRSQNLTFAWNTFINQTTIIPSLRGPGTWTVDDLNASVSDDIYTYSSTNQSTQDFKGYEFDATGWNLTYTGGISKFEVGLEIRTDTGGDDQLSVRVWTGKTWSNEYILNITSTTDTFFWTDVTGNITWVPNSIERSMYVRIKYIQVGAEATPIYVDWLPVRITPRNPVDVPEGSYFLWASAFLVDPITPFAFRPNEEENLTDNTLFGDPIVVTVVPVHNVAVTAVSVDPTDLAYGGSSNIRVKIRNLGNKEEVISLLAYANSTVVGSLSNIRLPLGVTRNYAFAWYQASNSAVEGYYNVTAYIPPVVGESNSTDNVLNSTVLMRLLPVASFTFSPPNPIKGQEIAFSASASYAPGVPGGTITEYRWDFGDGSTGTSATIQHTFASSGDKSVKLTVVDDIGLSSSSVRTVKVLKLNSSITMTVSLLTVPISLNTTISGAIAPVRANAIVSINCAPVTEGNWLKLANVTTDSNGRYSFVWSPTKTGTYKFNATWLGDPDTLGATSSAMNVIVTIQDVAIFRVAPAEFRVFPGDSLDVKVIALNKGTATETFGVSVYYNDTLLETKSVSNLVSGANTTLTFVLDTNDLAEGAYVIRAVASALQGETSIVDNTQISGFTLLEAQQEAGTSIFLYTTIALAIVIVAMAVYTVYILRLKKSKP